MLVHETENTIPHNYVGLAKRAPYKNIIMDVSHSL